MAKNNLQFYDMILDEEQAAFVAAVKDLTKTIVFCDAPAGTGKTTLAMGVANILVQDKRNELDGIVYIVSPYGEGKQGYLPGSITEKRKPNDGIVNLLTHTYLRGTNLQKKVVILDESQNYTVAELKKVLTRCHDSCKVIVIGHTGQIDIRGGSGFQRYLEHFQGQEQCAVCRLITNHRGWLSTYADELEE